MMGIVKSRKSESYLSNSLVVESSGVHVKAKEGYKYFKVRSSVFDKDGKEIKASIKNQEVQTESEEEALKAGFNNARYWAQTSF